ncbi:MAG: LPS assembly protein LptD [Myxococcales bacterium]|nr:LPS assembly protein LptD [Myxococcales bacterium]
MTALGPLLLTLAAAPHEGIGLELSADRLIYEPGKQLLTAKGNAELTAEGVSLRAEEVIYDQASQLVTARGRVALAVAQGGTYAVVAESIRVRIEGAEVREIFVESGRVMEKRGVPAQALLAARTPEELASLGTSSLVLSGTHLKRAGPSRWDIDGLSFTPCDCAPGQPSWRVEASQATVDVDGEYATLSFPTFYVRSVPVLWLPWVYLPLSSRRTGLLVPRVGSSSLSGLTVEAPLFVTLGESHDLTFTPGFFAGGRDALQGVKGGRLLTEYRYAPSLGTSGRATLGLLYDLNLYRDPVVPSKRAEPQGHRGLRAEGSLQHTQDLGSGWHDRVSASFVSDGYYVRDVTADLLAREAEYLRSSATLYRRTEQLYAGVELGVRQDLSWGYPLFGSGPNTLQRLPALVLALPERRVLGPLRAGLRVEYARLAPFDGGTGDEGTAANEGRPSVAGSRLPWECLRERLFFPEAASRVPELCGPPPLELDDSGLPTQGNRKLDRGEREARSRLDLFPRVSASFPIGELATVTPYAAIRQDLYLGEVTGQPSQRAYPIAGLAVETELARTFGSGEGAIRHSVTPAVEARYVPLVFGQEPAPYDEVDASLSADGERRLLHAVAEVRQRLLHRRGGSAAELLRLDLGQGFDLLDGRLADSYGRLSASIGALTAGAQARCDLPAARLVQLSAGLALDSGKGDALYASYENLFSEGSDRSRRGIDALVGPLPARVDDRALQLSVGARTSLKLGLTAQYDALFGQTRSRKGLALAQHILSLGYGPACDCWKVTVHLAQRRGPEFQPQGPAFEPVLRSTPEFGVSLSISNLGSFGTSG